MPLFNASFENTVLASARNRPGLTGGVATSIVAVLFLSFVACYNWTRSRSSKNQAEEEEEDLKRIRMPHKSAVYTNEQRKSGSGNSNSRSGFKENLHQWRKWTVNNIRMRTTIYRTSIPHTGLYMEAHNPKIYEKYLTINHKPHRSTTTT
ncbi:hypothetical protein C8R44DRAFT_742117 [Mycena epipterygia]|nr:hypothetical protein C8R44DRAFT_742117 [Mycena epipterygia]